MKDNKSNQISVLFWSAVLLPSIVMSEISWAQDIWHRDTISGDWNGNRSALVERGITFEAVYTGEITRNTSGGIRRKTEYLDNTDLTLSLDADQLFGWRGASFFIYVLGNSGGNPTEENVGDAQGHSNIEAPDTWKIYEAWYEQSFIDDRLALKVGLYDLNSEFDVIETAGLFLSSSHGIGPDFSQSGTNGPSIFPTTSFGVRALGQLTDEMYLQVVVLDGVPGDPNDPKGTHINFESGDGALLVVEAGYMSAEESMPYTKLAIGAWRYTEDSIEDASGNGIAPENNNGVYVIAERAVYQEKGTQGQGLAVFGRYGVAESKINQFDSYFGAGFVYTGLFPGRDEDQLGLAVAVANNGDEYKQASAPVDDKEVTWELSYRAQVTPWLAVHPDIQYVIDPGTDPSLDDATVLSVRFELVF